MRFCDSDGRTVTEVDPARYREFIGEKAESWSYTSESSRRPGAAASSTRSNPSTSRENPRICRAATPAEKSEVAA